MSKMLSLFLRRLKVPQPNPYDLPRIAFSKCAMNGCGAHYPERKNRWFCWTHQMVLFKHAIRETEVLSASLEERTPVIHLLRPKAR